jgi:hypothetical protein
MGGPSIVFVLLGWSDGKINDYSLLRGLTLDIHETGEQQVIGGGGETAAEIGGARPINQM